MICSNGMADETPANPAQRKQQASIGLCADCLHVLRIVSDRGSIFYSCLRAKTDPGFPKYPRLPVLICPGYEAKSTAKAE